MPPKKYFPAMAPFPQSFTMICFRDMADIHSYLPPSTFNVIRGNSEENDMSHEAFKENVLRYWSFLAKTYFATIGPLNVAPKRKILPKMYYANKDRPWKRFLYYLCCMQDLLEGEGEEINSTKKYFRHSVLILLYIVQELAMPHNVPPKLTIID